MAGHRTPSVIRPQRRRKSFRDAGGAGSLSPTLYMGVILSVAVFQAERRISSRETGGVRENLFRRSPLNCAGFRMTLPEEVAGPLLHSSLIHLARHLNPAQPVRIL